MKTAFQNEVEASAAGLTDDPGVADGMRRHRRETRFISCLIKMRNVKRLTQRKLAEKMGVTTSKISRMEASGDEDLNFGDIQAYVNALDMDMSILFDSSDLPAASRIKQHVFAVSEQLDKLSEIARQQSDDTDIPGKIKNFYGEVLFNFLRKFDESYSSLPGEPLQFPARKAGLPEEEEEAVVHAGA